MNYGVLTRAQFGALGTYFVVALFMFAFTAEEISPQKCDVWVLPRATVTHAHCSYCLGNKPFHTQMKFCALVEVEVVGSGPWSKACRSPKFVEVLVKEGTFSFCEMYEPPPENLPDSW